jgi:hypothetical protein
VAKKRKLSSISAYGHTAAGRVRYLAGYGTKYMVREDRTLWRLDPCGEYVQVAESKTGRVRVYHRGTESRRSMDVIMDTVFPDLTDAEIIIYDQGRGVPPGGGPLALDPIRVDKPPALLGEILEDLESSVVKPTEDDSEDSTNDSLFDL